MSLTTTLGSAGFGTSAVTPNLPAGVSTGDVVLLYWAVDQSSSPSTPTPTNYNLVTTSTNGASMKAAVWWRIWPSGGSAPSVSWTGGGKARCWLERVQGADTTTPVYASNTNNTSSASMPTADAGTANRRGSRLTALFVNTTANTAIAGDERLATLNEGTTGTTTSSTDGRVGIVAYERMAEGAPSQLAAGNYAATAANAAWCGITFWLQPAVADDFGCLQARYQLVAANATNALAFGSALTSGSLLVAKLTAWSGNSSSVVYGGGSVALTLADRANNSTFERAELWYYENNSDTTAATVTATNAGANDNTMVIEEWLGAATSGGPVTTGTFSSSGSTTCNVTSSGNTPAGPSLVVSVHHIDANSGTATLDANSQRRAVKQNTSNMAIAAQSRELTSGGSTVTVNYTSASGGAAGVLAVFDKAAAGTTLRRYSLMTLGAG